jgi:hypothetical protein
MTYEPTGCLKPAIQPLSQIRLQPPIFYNRYRMSIQLRVRATAFFLFMEGLR